MPGDRALIERAVLGEVGHNDHLWTRKVEALAAEADMLSKSQSHHVQVESESFSGSSPIAKQLIGLAANGVDVDLIVAEAEYNARPSERRSVHSLAVAGVHVRLSNADEKFAVAGDAIWIGSANATGGAPNQVDFGLVLNDGVIANRLSAQFDREWQSAWTPTAND